MSMFFNADEVFEIAEQIERNGARFYRKAAGSESSDENRQILEKLASMEDDHEKTFAAMRRTLAERDRESRTFDPQDEAAMYMRAMADGNVFDTRRDPSEMLNGRETMADILSIAIGLEKDSIIYYLGMKDLIPPELGKEKIDSIIREEMRHITLLNRQLMDIRR
jgi:rubrerythrin